MSCVSLPHYKKGLRLEVRLFRLCHACFLPSLEGLWLVVRLVSLCHACFLPPTGDGFGLDVKLVSLRYVMLLCNQNRSGGVITGKIVIIRFVVKWLATQKSFFSLLLRARSNCLTGSKIVVPNAIRKISVRFNSKPKRSCVSPSLKVHCNRSTHFPTLLRNGSKFTIDLVPLNLRKQEACNANSPGRARSAEEDVDCTTAWFISSPKKLSLIAVCSLVYNIRPCTTCWTNEWDRVLAKFKWHIYIRNADPLEKRRICKFHVTWIDTWSKKFIEII